MALSDELKKRIKVAITNEATANELIAAIESGGGGGTWGSITGTLSDQSDLQSALNGKQPTGSYVTSLTGDVVASGPGAAAAILANSVNIVYVDFISGSDSTGTGSITRPWKTVQKAYDSISPSINVPYTIKVSGGNNVSDTNPINGKDNVSIVSDYQIQMQGITITSVAANSNGCSFVNLTFLNPVTWIRNDALTMAASFYNCEFFNGPVIKQTGAGVCSVQAFNSLFVNADFGIINGGFGVFSNCTFYGNTVFRDPGNGGFSYLEFENGYSSGNMSFTGLYNPIYFTGFVHDVVFGASVTFAAGTGGPPPLEIDANGLPPTYTGTPGAITLLSQSKHEAYEATTPGDWNGSPASNVEDAIDRIAAALNALGHKP